MTASTGSQAGNDCPDSWSSLSVKAIEMLLHRHAQNPISQVESVQLTMDSDNHRIVTGMNRQASMRKCRFGKRN